MKYSDIKELIPQRDPILMVDELLEVNGEKAHTLFTVHPDCLFLDRDDRLEESGLIEHIAQSASVFAGYLAISTGTIRPPIGYIGEVKKFRCYYRPMVGNELNTTITLGPEAGGVRLLSGVVNMRDTMVAETQMKIFIQPDS